MSALEDSADGTVVQDRRRGVDRRAVIRRMIPSDQATNGRPDRRGAERRRTSDRRDVPALFCPDCHEPLRYEAGLSWYLVDTYTVDAGYCPSCLRRFLRDRETGGYDKLAW